MTWAKGAKSSLSILSLALLFWPQSSFAVRWEQQAERLQLISSSFLDLMPVAKPARLTSGLLVYSDVMFLPSFNPTVGSKAEKASAPPASAWISAEPYFSFRVSDYLAASLGVNLSALPPVPENLFGTEIEGLGYGAFLGLQWRSGDKTMEARASLHRADSKASGAITADDAKDTFKSKNTAGSFSLLITNRPFEASLSLSLRQSLSLFYIASDDTRFRLHDRIEMVPQAGIGFNLTEQFSVWAFARHVSNRFTSGGIGFVFRAGL